MTSLTAKDQELISLLQVNAREPVSALARKLGLSRTTVQDRLRRLEQAGIIAGYQLRLSEDTEPGGIRAFVTIEVEPKRTNDVARALQRMPQVEALYFPFDPKLEQRARGFDGLRQLRAPTGLDEIGRIEAVGHLGYAEVKIQIDRGS